VGDNNQRVVLLLNDGTSHINDLTTWKVDTVDEEVDPYDQYLTLGGTYAFLSSTDSNTYWHVDAFVLSQSHFTGAVQDNIGLHF